VTAISSNALINGKKILLRHKNVKEANPAMQPANAEKI
jgi:hypothetical protein